MIAPNTKVKMSEDLKKDLLSNGCYEHVVEFGDCIGIVQGTADGFNDPHLLDIRWQPSNLRYAYFDYHLIIME